VKSLGLLFAYTFLLPTEFSLYITGGITFFHYVLYRSIILKRIVSRFNVLLINVDFN
jgi:hypothetical protein